MEVSREAGLIQLAVSFIKNDNLTRLDKALRVMPLEKLKDKHEDLLSSFLKISSGYNRPEAAKMILERWKVVYPEQDKISILPRLFLMNNINVPTLSFLVNSDESITFVEIMDELSEWDNSPEVVTACARADQIFGPQPFSTYEAVKDHAFEFGNYKVEDYMKEKMKEIAPYAPKPEYVKNYLGGELMTETELAEKADKESKIDIKDTKYISDEEAVNLLTKGMQEFGIAIPEIDQAKMFLLEKLQNMDAVQRHEILKPVVQNIQEEKLDSDRLLFQTFGPAHPLIDQDLSLDTPSAKYGGCRMFLCDLFDYDFEFGYLPDWFTGACSTCLQRIRYRWYAVRRPRVLGGWENEYCSFKCVRESLLEDGLEPAVVLRRLIDRFEKRINEIGIQDRLPDSPEKKSLILLKYVMIVELR